MIPGLQANRLHSGRKIAVGPKKEMETIVHALIERVEKAEFVIPAVRRLEQVIATLIDRVDALEAANAHQANPEYHVVQKPGKVA